MRSRSLTPLFSSLFQPLFLLRSDMAPQQQAGFAMGGGYAVSSW